ncbi:hypothetical protein FRC07_000927 [Ceratobasidium sp. 392]|nr:hypothetical protein FRC07_000927 [Ceratobasidium sp. 392]
MATEAYRIVSDYALPDENHEIAVPKEAVLSADADALWESEAGPSRISLKRRIPPRFVAATNSHSIVEQTKTEAPIKSESGDIGSWYAGLSRTTQTPELRQTQTQTPTPPPPQPTPVVATKSTKQKPSKNDWFIRRALSHVSDAPPVPTSSLADMLEQTPPSLQDPLQPPVFLHLNPTNRGWGMLQRHGWEEGQPLGLGLGARTAPPTPPHEDTSTAGGTPSESNDGNPAAPARTALVTPLRTTLKVDKRGIGPRSKSMPRPSVTHSMSDIRMAAEKARRERDGRGKRGFARTAKREAEERSRIFQELK